MFSSTFGSVWYKVKGTCAGQIMWLSEIESMIFIGSPLVSSLTELQQRHLYLSDMPVYDVTRELVLLNQQRMAELEVR